MKNFGIGMLGFVLGAVLAVAVIFLVHPFGPGAEEFDKLTAEKNAAELKQTEQMGNFLAEKETILAGKVELENKIDSLEEELDEVKNENAEAKIELAETKMIIARQKLDEALAAAPKPKPEQEQEKELTEEEKKKEREKKELVNAIELLQRVNKIGDSLSETAIKDLGLNKEQVEDVNAVLKDEGERMTERLREFAAELVDGKTAEDFKDKNGVQISMEIQSYFMDDLKKLMALPPEKQAALQTGEKHVVEFLPKDSRLVRIIKVFYDERQATYRSLGSTMDEKTEAKFKEKYLQSGTFIFPGGAGYGMGELTEESFDE